MPKRAKPQQMKCGGCGGKLCTIKAVPIGEGSDVYSALIVTCTKCKSVTTFKIEPSKIVVDWTANPHSAGTHCIGWDD